MLSRPACLRRLDFALLGMFVAALVLRVLWILIADLDLRGKFNYDITWYDLSGLTIAARGEFAVLNGPATAYSAPGYPALLGLTYWLFGQSVLGPQVVNVLLGSATCLLAYKWGALLAGRSVGLFAGWLLTLYPASILFTPLILSEVTFSFVLTTTCLFFSAWMARDAKVGLIRWIVWGALLGLASLIRATPLAFPAVPALIWLFASRSWRYAARHTLAVLIGLVLVVAPWSVRNFLELDALVLVSTNMGATLVIAKLPDRVRAEWNSNRPSDLGEVESNRIDRDAAIEYAMNHPVEDLLRIPSRLEALVWDSDVALNWGRSANPLLPGIPDDWLSAIINTYHRAVLFLVLFGLPCVLVRSRPERWILPGAVAYVLFLHSVIFQGNPRFLLPFLPMLCIIAAMGCVSIVAFWRKRWIASGEA